MRLGLNPTYRSMAACLKYDRQLPDSEEARIEKHHFKRPVKGYYGSEADLVKKIKSNVAPDFSGHFKLLECSIMDLADDIAYSTYDLEDAFKAKFLSPLGMIAETADFKSLVASEINTKLVDEYGKDAPPITKREVDGVLNNFFFDLFDGRGSAAEIHRRSSVLTENGYVRTEFTSRLVHLFINGIGYHPNRSCRALSVVKFGIETFKMVEVMKKYAYLSLIMSPRLKMAESRGRDIIKHIFAALKTREDGKRLLPEDWKEVYLGQDNRYWRRRAVCDFIASMTDRYCLEFYSRLVGIDVPSIHKPY